MWELGQECDKLSADLSRTREENRVLLEMYALVMYALVTAIPDMPDTQLDELIANARAALEKPPCPK